MDRDSATQLRLQLLANGYSPIRNRDKRTFMVGWPKEEITPDVIAYWARKFRRDLATGIRVENGLAVIDFDIDDRGVMSTIFGAVLDAVPLLDNEFVPLLRRTGSGAKEAWFVRTDETFGRMFSRSWTKPGENADEHEVHRIEIFGGASARQFGAFGPHTVTDDGEVLKSYGWIDASPADTPLAQLPVLAKSQLSKIVDTVERVLEAAGWQPVLLSTKGENDVQRVFDLVEGMLFDTNTGERLSLRELHQRALSHDGLRCSASWLEPGSVNRTRCIVTTDHEDRLCVWESASGVTHMEADAAPRPKPDTSEKLAKLKELAEAAGVKPDPRPAEPPRTRKEDPRVLYRVRPTDRAVAAAAKLLKLYAYCPNHPRTQVLPIYADGTEDGMTVQSLRFLFAANNDESIGPRGGRQVISPADIWLNSEDRVTVEGIRMRPDREWPLYQEEGKLWINSFLMPTHEGVILEGEDVFNAFMEHLLPDPIERDWFLDWLAHKWRFPEVPGPGVIMVAQKQGAGRGTLFAMLTQLFGERHVSKVDGGSITGDGGQSQYNRWLGRSVLILIDELFNSGTGAHLWQRKKAYDRIKGLIDPAARRVEIVQKTLNNFDTHTFASFLMATNNANALPLEEGDRRICVLLNGDQLEVNPALALALARFRRGAEYTPGFIAMIAHKLSSRDLSNFDAFATPPMFEGKKLMIERNITDVGEAADEVIEELPGDYVTRNAFLDRVRMKLGDAARDHKNLTPEARDRLDKKWEFLGRTKVRENGAKADVWARTKLHARHWSGVSWTDREGLLAACADPRQKATAAQRAALARGLSVLRGQRGDPDDT